METLKSLANILNQVPAETWSLAAQSIISAFAISPIALGFKKWWKVNSEKIMLLIVIIGSIVTPVIIYLLQSPHYSAYIVPVIAMATFASTQPVYIYFVKPLYLRGAAWFATQVAEAAKLNEAKSAEVPASGLPIGNSGDQNV